MNSDKLVFLLGGYDLEMLEIKNILLSRGYIEGFNLFDKQLSWGAKLSDYQKEIEARNIEDITPVAIELTEDIPLPINAIRIDHHNEYSHLPSSLEQVCNLFGIVMNRKQKLIAANDSGYIPAMLEMGASSEEIDEIRRADRAAQGVSEEDERLAEKSIQENLSIENGVTIIKSLTPKFSPITDRRFGKDEHLIIYTDKNLCYYGQGKSRLVEHYSELIKKDQAFSGGRANGFFGFADNVFDGKEIEGRIIPEIIKIITHG